ncbi:ATP-binding protein [Pelagibius sp. CAU 1746]|uniref:sensor histidine kinase n=1 Tax=Pelagibius sp. CAU 1746 TaxID=3140370 RepID=UPI00325AFCB7
MASTAKQHFSEREQLRCFDLLNTPIWIFDVERHAVWWANRRALQFWRAQSLDELLARDFASDSPAVRQRLAQVIAKTPPGEVASDTWTLYPNDTPVTVLLAMTPVTVEDGRDAMLIESSAPLDLHSNEEALRLLEATRYTSLMVSTFSLEGRLLSRNPAAIDTFGKSNEKKDAADNDLDRQLGDPQVAEALRQSVSGGHPFARDLKVRTAQGPRWHQVQAQRGRDPRTGEGVIVVTETDITGRVQAEARLASLNSELEKRVRQRTAALERSNEEAIEARYEAERANRIKSKFLANMSHELRTPLNAILGFSDIIRLGVFGPINERYLEYVTDINASALHLLGLIDGLLDLAKIEAGKMMLQESELDLRALLNETLQMIAATNQGNGKELRLECPLPEVPLLADARLIKQVALNLLSNAAKFTPEQGSITVAVRPGGATESGGENGGLEVRFTDNGIGIDAGKLDLVFRPYEHNASFAGGVKNTGLGLPIARSFVELHGGSLHLESKLGEGTTAVLRLPAARVLTRSAPLAGAGRMAAEH